MQKLKWIQNSTPRRPAKKISQPTCLLRGVTVEIDENQIALVSLNRADKYNALDMAMFHAIADTAKSLAKNKQVRVVIVRGHGKNFCTGLDVKSIFSRQNQLFKALV